MTIRPEYDNQAAQVRVVKPADLEATEHRYATASASQVRLTEAGKARESIVTHAIESACEGARLLEEAIDWAEIIRPSHENKSLLVRVRQFVEEMEQTL